MTLHGRMAAAMLGVLSFAISPALAQDASPVYVVTYVEVKPTAKADADALLKSYRDAARRDTGNLRSEVMQHASRPGQFVILAAWKDPQALDAHMGAASTKSFRERIEGLRNSPLDDRIHTGLSVARLEEARGVVHVVTHVDVVPPRKDEAVALLKSLGEASRGDEGNVRYEVVQQTNRANHFTVLESWKSRQALDQHSMAAHVREFRDKLKPMSGALYDERLYEPLN
jgi:quinol monooxygenase YgiN